MDDTLQIIYYLCFFIFFLACMLAATIFIVICNTRKIDELLHAFDELDQDLAVVERQLTQESTRACTKQEGPAAHDLTDNPHR